MTKEVKNGTEPVKVKGKKRHGCLIALLVIVVIIGIAAIIVFRVPEKIGLVKSPAEKMYAQANDTEKAALMVAGLQKYGINIQGVEVYVMPVKDTDHNTAFIILDSSKGFNFNNSGIHDPIAALVSIAAQAQQQGINRAAVVYYDGQGKALVTVTATTADILAYSQGKITKEQLMKKVDIGANDLMGVLDAFRTGLK
jgi:hypothetical protein